MRNLFICAATLFAGIMPLQLPANQNHEKIHSALEENRAHFLSELEAGRLNEMIEGIKSNKDRMRLVEKSLQKTWEEEAKNHKKQTLASLNELAKAYSDLEASKTYQAIKMCASLTDEEEADCRWYSHLISGFFLPEQGNLLEEKMDELATEFNLRKLLIEVPFVTEQKWSKEEFDMIRANLELELFQKLLTLSEQNEELHQRIETVQKVYAQSESSWKYLQSLSRVKEFSNKMEGEVAEIMKGHLQNTRAWIMKIGQYFEENIS